MLKSESSIIRESKSFMIFDNNKIERMRSSQKNLNR
jgi:hypothetical protein